MGAALPELPFDPDAAVAVARRLEVVLGDRGSTSEVSSGSGELEEPNDVDPTRAGRRRPRILVADDEASMRLLLSVNLPLAGFDVVEAENGATALEKAAGEELDLALLDVMMPDVSGHDVARELRRRTATAELPIVFLSARASREDIRIGYELGAVDYVTKPFDPISVGEHLREVLDRVRDGSAEQVRAERLEGLSRG